MNAGKRRFFSFFFSLVRLAFLMKTKHFPFDSSLYMRIYGDATGPLHNGVVLLLRLGARFSKVPKTF